MEAEVLLDVYPGPAWDWRVAADLFLGGAGVGAFLFAVALHAAFGGRYRRITQTAAWLAPVLVTGGLLLLLSKLGRPFHLWVTVTRFAPTSPLWWGGIFQTIFVVGSLWFALQWRRDAPDPKRRRLGWMLVPIAVIVGAYHGMLLAVVTARPLWNTGPTVVAALLGFATTGIAAVMLTHLIRMKLGGRLVQSEHLETFLEDMRPVRLFLVATLVLQLGTLFLWWTSLHFGSLQDRQALAAANETHGMSFWTLGIGAGLILPLLLGGLAWWRGDKGHRVLQVRTIMLTSLLILVGGYVFRFALVLGGQATFPVPSLS